MGKKTTAESVVREIRRKTRKQYSSEEKIRIVLDGLRGEDSIQPYAVEKGSILIFTTDGAKIFRGRQKALIG